MISVFIIFLSLFIFSSAFPNPSEKFNNSVVLRDDVYRLFWKVEGDVVTFEVQVKTKGWIGLGLSPNGSLKGADLVVGWINKNEKLEFKDRHTISDSVAFVDSHQDWVPLWGLETGEFTVIKFSRRLKTCDTHDLEITFGSIRLIYAWSSKKPDSSTANLNLVSGQSQSGNKTVDILTSVDSPPQSTEKTKQFRFFVNNYNVPGTTTAYLYVYFALPLLQTKHHVISFEAAIQPGNEDLVEHILVINCNSSADPSKVAQFAPDAYRSLPCSQVAWPWSLGRKKFEFPSDVGYIYGGPQRTRVIALEIHYNNQDQNPDRYDSSGVIMTVTPNLRTNEADLMHSVNRVVIIPPKQNDFPIYAKCDFNPFVNTSNTTVTEINLIATLLHANSAARTMRLRHLRGPNELSPILDQPYYDTDDQQTFILPQGPVAYNLKTDTLVTECRYDTSDRTNVTWFDGSTQGEWCLSFTYYYPSISSSGYLICGSQPDQKLWLAAAVGINYTSSQIVTAPPSLANMTLIDAMNTLDWADPSISTKFKDMSANNTGRIFCDDNIFLSNSNRIQLTSLIFSPYHNNNTCIPKFLEHLKEDPPKACKPDKGNGHSDN